MWADGVSHDARGWQSLHDLQEEQLSFFFGAQVEQVTIIVSAAENGQNFAANRNLGLRVGVLVLYEWEDAGDIG